MDKIIHVCNVVADSIEGAVPVTSLAELDKCSKQDVSAWFIFAHLTWDGQRLTQNYGFDVAQRIRMEFGSLAPIIFYSPIKEEYFTSLPGWKYKLLNGCGSAFFVSGTTASKRELDSLLKSTAALTTTSLLDVVTMLCNVRGLVVDRLNHDLKPEDPSQPVFSVVEPMLSNTQKREVQFEEYRDKFAEVDNGRSAAAFMDLRKTFIQACDALLPKDPKRKEVGAGQEKARKQHVLLLEDDPVFRRSTKDILSEEFTVHDVATSTEAIELLDQDKGHGKILAVICDWRLYEYRNDNSRSEHWQCPQGYSVLEYAAAHGVRALYALTSQDDRLVHAIRNKSDRRYSLFKKEHLNGPAQWQVLLDVLSEGCHGAMLDRADLVIQGAKGWVDRGDHDRSKQEAYIEIMNSMDRELFFDEVTTLANKVWKAYVANENIYIVGDYPGLEYAAKANDRNDMKKFFVLRRLYFGIWIDRKSGTLRGSALTRHDAAVQEVIWNTHASASQRRNKLCINFKEINIDRMFNEEVAWLRAHNQDPDKAG